MRSNWGRKVSVRGKMAAAAAVVVVAVVLWKSCARRLDLLKTKRRTRCAGRRTI